MFEATVDASKVETSDKGGEELQQKAVAAAKKSGAEGVGGNDI